MFLRLWLVLQLQVDLANIKDGLCLFNILVRLVIDLGQLFEIFHCSLFLAGADKKSYYIEQCRRGQLGLAFSAFALLLSLYRTLVCNLLLTLRGTLGRQGSGCSNLRNLLLFSRLLPLFLGTFPLLFGAQ